ncbi:nucleotide sugar dehydrogenase [Aliikangiella coralliicola]|uniref:UDP-glucose 6-dehydrogenase n=1 Tax=Aliikangiella coralliicola TaxID=2592383 RepID=A0A545TSN8_9GAMM|nr:nucleotide sugar dehydrogenase [Aliikangiella coralliicola]TQV80229.1 UDP-glucose/GDP-mannose dehydrogenase family protein [Aliikangiella coralliicola]
MRVAVIGDGMKSLVTAGLMASVGNQVIVFNSTNTDCELLMEPGLANLLTEQHSSGRLNYLSEIVECELDIIIITDVSPIESYAQFKMELKNSVINGATFVILTPSFIGESEQLELEINEISNSAKVCCVPLLIREGKAISDFSRPDRIILGCDDAQVLTKVRELFYPFNRVTDVIKVVKTREAEFSCFAGNAMLATRLSFMNEMANLAERSHVDIDIVRECIGSDPRIGRDYLYPGCGYGGKALAENVERVARELRLRSDDLGLLDVVTKINDRQKDLLFRKIWSFFATELKGKTIAIWGGSFKPDSSNIDRAPAIVLIDALLAQSANVVVYDPSANEKIKHHYSNNQRFRIAPSAYAALESADVLAICTEWREFWSPDFDKIAESLNYKAIFDGRNLYSPDLLRKYQIRYFGIGKGEVI